MKEYQVFPPTDEPDQTPAEQPTYFMDESNDGESVPPMTELQLLLAVLKLNGWGDED